MNECRTCAWFEAGEFEARVTVIIGKASDYFQAKKEDIPTTYDGVCLLAKVRNPYHQWLEGAELPIRQGVPGAPMQTDSDGCCSGLAVKADFGCKAWEKA